MKEKMQYILCESMLFSGACFGEKGMLQGSLHRQCHPLALSASMASDLCTAHQQAGGIS